MDKLANFWINALNKKISLREIIANYLIHLVLHLQEISQIIKEKEDY